MKFKTITIAVSLFIVYTVIVPRPCETADTPAIRPFTKDDRVLVLAPHPDDETIGAGGAIERALKSGAAVKIVCLTNGDHNELAFIAYERRLTFRTGEFIHMGEVRRQETINAMAYLGIKKEDIIFLGYPDFGTRQILLRYWDPSKPFRNLLTRISHVAYPEAPSFGLPYVGENILKDLKKIIVDFRPTVVFVSHPADHNGDHQTLYVFLRIAMWDIGRAVPAPDIFPYLIHVIGWPVPQGLHSDLRLVGPKKINGVKWQEFELNTVEIREKQNAIAFYKSQNTYNPRYLYTFVRRNELFGDYPPVVVKKNGGPAAWQSVSPGNRRGEKTLPAFYYARVNDDLYLTINFQKSLEKELSIDIDLLGYAANSPFDKMPKIKINLGPFGMHVRENGKRLTTSGIELVNKGNVSTVKIPLASLGHPDYIVAKLTTNLPGITLDQMSWRILELR